MPLIVAIVVALGMPNGVLDADELADRLGAAEGLVKRNFETTFEYRVGKASPDVNEGDLETAEWTLLETFRYVAFGNRLFIARTSFEHPSQETSAIPLVQVRQFNVWADGVWSQRIEGDPGVSFFAEARPTDLQKRGFIFNLIEGRFPSRPTLEDLVRSGSLINQSMADGVLTYRFSVAGTEASRAQYTIRARLVPEFALLGFTVDLSDATTPEDLQRHLILRQIYTVLEWKQVDGLQIPWIAQIESFGPDDDQGGVHLSSRSIYTRKSFREITADEVDPALFTVPLPIGTNVFDQRYDVSFRIGDRSLVVDGVVYEVDEPILEHPGDRLTEILREARPYYPPPGASSGSALREVDAQQEPRRWRLPAVLTALVGAGSALLAFALLRLRAGRGADR